MKFKNLWYKVVYLYQLYLDDGDEDVVVCNNVGAPEIFKNIGGNKQNWIKVKVMHRLVANSKNSKNKACVHVGQICRNWNSE